MTALVDRPDLVETVLNAPGPVVIVEAPAGMGKTALLALIAARLDLPVVSTLAPPPASAAVTLWDLPAQGDAGPLPERLFTPGNRQRLILARRPGRAVPGLARAIAYGQASRIGPEVLMVGQTELTALFGTDAPDLADVGGGWPLIVFRPAVLTLDEAALADFLAADLIDALDEGDLVALALLLGGAGGAGETGRAESAETLARLLPLVRPGSGGRLEPALARLAGPMARALDQVIARRVGEAGRAKALAEHFAARGRPVEAIGIFQRAGFFDLALKLFESAGGFFLLYFCGPAAFDRVLSGFPRTLAMQSEALVLAHALQAMKSGDIARARRLLVDRFGPAAHDLGQLFSPRSIFSREFRAFRLLMLLYEDHFLAEEESAQAFALASEFRQDDHLFRGSFYNSMLEFYIRNRQFAEAEDVAQRAMAHYQAAGSAHLAFYISLHQALIRLMMGDALAARKQAVRGAAHLDAMGFDSPNDRRLQQLLEACIDYESGRAEPLARFLSLEIDDFSHGEIWPSLLDLALHYGSQALGEHFSVLAARSFLERWRVYQASNGQFQTMIAVREAAVLQNANRWQEAAGVLSAIASPVDRALVLSAGSALTGLKDRDELALALAWLRQTVYEQPQREGLDALLGAMTANLALTERQRMAVEIWRAYVTKRQRDLTRTRALLQKTFGDCARLGTIAPLSEERVFLQDLIDNQRITGFLTTTLANRQILRRLRDAGRLAGDSADARSLLSRREAKILLMISEGAANKFVANTLGLSEATVKFHLGNIYRKLGCRGRQQAIASARALGLIG